MDRPDPPCVCDRQRTTIRSRLNPSGCESASGGTIRKFESSVDAGRDFRIIRLARGADCLLGSGYHDHAPVAQLDRVPGYEPGGREFESLRARHSRTDVTRVAPGCRDGDLISCPGGTEQRFLRALVGLTAFSARTMPRLSANAAGPGTGRRGIAQSGSALLWEQDVGGSNPSTPTNRSAGSDAMPDGACQPDQDAAMRP